MGIVRSSRSAAYGNKELELFAPLIQSSYIKSRTLKGERKKQRSPYDIWLEGVQKKTIQRIEQHYVVRPLIEL